MSDARSGCRPRTVHRITGSAAASDKLQFAAFTYTWMVDAMACSLSFTRTAIAAGLLAAMTSAPLPLRADNAPSNGVQAADDTAPAELAFITAADAATFHAMAERARRAPAPDARIVASAFIREQLGLDGDAYVVAHFGSAADRARGKPDHVLSLTSALMEAFPDASRHSFFAEASDAVGGLNSGGAASPDVLSFVENAYHSTSAGDFFRKFGRFLWSRSGPGYIYNTFFAQGSVVQTVGEDARPLDEAFGIYRTGGFTDAFASPLTLSSVVEKFRAPGLFDQLPYVAKLNRDLETYWDENRAAWPVLARYNFVREARRARDAGVLNLERYRQVMSEGAPQVPLEGAIALDQLRSGSPSGPGRPRRFDINGYAASDIVRFTAADGSEVMYVPGGVQAFMVFASEADLGEWVLQQAKDPQKLEALLSHFSIYNSQDSTFWTGVRHGLENIAAGKWVADGTAVDHADTVIDGDLFEDMREQVEARVREDAGMQVRTTWEAWRTTINRAMTLMAPLGYIPALALPFQVGSGVVGFGLGVDQGVNGRTAGERKAGLEQATMTVVTNVPLGAAFDGLKSGTAAEGEAVLAEAGRPSFVPPDRVNDRIGYPLSPTSPPRFSNPEGSGTAPAGSTLAQVIPANITREPAALERAAGILQQFGVSEARLSTAPVTVVGAHPQGSIALAAVGQGVIETLSARLRARTGTPWTLLELQLVAPVLAKQTRRALAVYGEDGTFQFAAQGDGDSVTQELIPPNALRLRKSGDGYVLLNANLQATRHTYRSVFAALEESTRASHNAHELDDTRLEQDFRTMLADSIDARSTRPELERMHRQWIDPMRLPERQKRLVKELSLLRQALVDTHEPWTAAQKRRLADSGVDVDLALSTAAARLRLLDDGVLARLADADSALLPPALEHLVVKDFYVKLWAFTQDADAWTFGGRHYIRLRHIDGRTQIVETAPAQGTAPREILSPGEGAGRETGRRLVDIEGMWYPETSLREGLAPIDPRAQDAVIEAIAEKLPASITRDEEAIACIVNAIPPPLVGYFKSSLFAITMEADAGLVLQLRDIRDGTLRRYVTYVNANGGASAPGRPMATPPAPLGELAGDTQLMLPVLRRVDGAAHGSIANPVRASYEAMLENQRPISEFVALGLGGRHIGALATTRRLRGMLREDSNVALVGATPDHALTLLLPANAETLRLVGPERATGRLVDNLPQGTLIVDNLYRVTASPAEYPSLVREVAREWQASGSTMTQVRPDGTEVPESPVDYTERLLTTPIRINLWNPLNDPISEQRYVRYLHRRLSDNGAVRHAGLDWLETQQARRDYMGYFAPPSNVLPFASPTRVPGRHAGLMAELADAAIHAGLQRAMAAPEPSASAGPAP